MEGAAQKGVERGGGVDQVSPARGVAGARPAQRAGSPNLVGLPRKGSDPAERLRECSGAFGTLRSIGGRLFTRQAVRLVVQSKELVSAVLDPREGRASFLALTCRVGASASAVPSNQWCCEVSVFVQF